MNRYDTYRERIAAWNREHPRARILHDTLTRAAKPAKRPFQLVHGAHYGSRFATIEAAERAALRFEACGEPR